MTDDVAPASQEPEPSAPPLVAPRRKTFLARYPRNLKLFLTTIFIALIAFLIVAPPFSSVKTVEWDKAKNFTQASLDELMKKLPNEEGETTSTEGRKVQTSADLPAVSASPVGTAEALAAADALRASHDVAVLAAIKENDTDDHDVRLVRAPDPGLTDETAEGPLPRISSDQRKAWQIYARPFNKRDNRPRIAIVISDLGLSNIATLAAVERLPSNVTMAFDAQSPIVGSWLARARQIGHETLLAVPAEPFDYPQSDPGPKTLLTNMPIADNADRLLAALRQGTGYVGVTTFSGSRFSTDTPKVSALLNIIKQRGLMVLDAHASPHSVISDLAEKQNVPVASSFTRIDTDPTPEAIDAALVQLEHAARLSGRAIGIAGPLPVTLARLEAWIQQLPARGIALAPVSALVETN